VFGDGGSADAGHRIGILEELSLTSYQLVFISSERGSGAGTARGGYAIEAIERFNYDPTAADGPQVVVTELLPGAHGGDAGGRAGQPHAPGGATVAGVRPPTGKSATCSR
jgi:hypothetical protein